MPFLRFNHSLDMPQRLFAQRPPSGVRSAMIQNLTTNIKARPLTEYREVAGAVTVEPPFGRKNGGLVYRQPPGLT